MNPKGCLFTAWLAMLIICAPCAQAGNHLSGVLAELTVVEAVALLCNKQISATEYAEALLQRHEVTACLNGYSENHPEKVLEQALHADEQLRHGEKIGPLCGLPLVVKDNIDVAGYVTAAGTPALEGHRPRKSSRLIEKFEEAGGIVLGKARMHELAEGFTTVSTYYGATLNPYRNDFHVGGSSGGTAALVAARAAPAGFCTDTSGSCRNPASLNGVVGYRPTTMGAKRQQCYRSGSGLVPMTTTRDTVGLMARSVADIQFLDSILSDCPKEAHNVSLSGLRIGYPREWWSDVGQEVQPAFDSALQALKSAGAELFDFDIALMLAEYRNNAPENFSYIYEMPREISRYLAYHQSNISLPELIDKMASPLAKASMAEWTFKELEEWPTPQDYLYMLAQVTPKITQLWTDYFDNLGFDVMVAPTSPITARPINASEPYSEINGRLEDILSVYSRTAELDCPSEVPGLSIPIGLATNGLPIGIQLHTRPGDDGLMLSVGRAMEAVLPKTPAPSRIPECNGKKAVVTLKQDWKNDPDAVILSSETAEQAAERLSMYDFSLQDATWQDSEDARGQDQTWIREEL